MDQLNKIEEVSKTEQNNDQVEQSNGKPHNDFDFEDPHHFYNKNATDIMRYPLDVEVSNIESLKSSTIKNFSYYSNSNSSNDYSLDSLDDKKLYEEEKKEVPQEVESQNIQEPLEKLNETNAEALNGAQQNADDGKEMVSTSISTSLFKPTNTQGVTEYTTFSEYVNNFSNKLPENLNVCAICEKLGARVQCVLECKRFFHYQCLHLMVTKKEVSDRQINCENCLIRQQICAYCGILCMISPSKFRKCSYDGCQYYFHLSCEDRLKESLYYKNVTSKTFICPSHFCGKCKNHILPEDEKVIECVRCYLKYHDGCWTSNDFKFITQTKMICFRHKVRKDKYANESRLMGIFDSKPALPSYVIVYNDPPINPGNDKILKEYNTLSLLPNAEGKSNPEKELTDFLKVAAQENFNISDAIGVMEKQLCLAIEKSSQILQAAKGLNLSDKMDMLYKNERAGKKLSNEEIYILSQKNLTQTYDMLQEKIKCKVQSKKQQLLEEAQISNDTNQEEVKLDYQPSHLDVIQESKLLQIQESADIEMEHEDNSNHENLEAQKDKTLLKPTSASDCKSKKKIGIRKTALMISNLFGASAIKQRVKMHLEKRYKELENLIENNDSMKPDQQQS